MLPLRALLFDLDGTLADTASANVAAYAAALAEAGIDVDPAQLARESHGRNWRQFLPGFIAASGRDANAEAIANRKKALYAQQVAGIALNRALLRLIGAARPALRTALVTTASRANVDALLEAHALRESFDVIVTGDDVARHKPDAEAYLLAARRLGIDATQCLAFEDSDIGEQSARAAGISVVRVSFSPDSPDALDTSS